MEAVKGGKLPLFRFMHTGVQMIYVSKLTDARRTSRGKSFPYLIDAETGIFAYWTRNMPKISSKRLGGHVKEKEDCFE